MSAQLDKVAEAICRSDNPRPDDQPADAYEWDIKAILEDNSQIYRSMAQAAIDALGLTEEWAIFSFGNPIVMSERAAQERAERWPESFKPHVRLATPWAVAERGAE